MSNGPITPNSTPTASTTPQLTMWDKWFTNKGDLQASAVQQGQANATSREVYKGQISTIRSSNLPTQTKLEQAKKVGAVYTSPSSSSLIKNTSSKDAWKTYPGVAPMSTQQQQPTLSIWDRWFTNKGELQASAVQQGQTNVALRNEYKAKVDAAKSSGLPVQTIAAMIQKAGEVYTAKGVESDKVIQANVDSSSLLQQTNQAAQSAYDGGKQFVADNKDALERLGITGEVVLGVAGVIVLIVLIKK